MGNEGQTLHSVCTATDGFLLQFPWFIFRQPKIILLSFAWFNLMFSLVNSQGITAHLYKPFPEVVVEKNIV